MAKAKQQLSQQSLIEILDEEDIEYEWHPRLNLGWIIKPDDSPQPSKKFIASVKAHKRIYEPLLLHNEGRNRFSIFSGRRRYLAAEICGLESVPALSAKLSPAHRAVLSMKLNAQREDNIIADIKALESLLQGGYTEEEIARESTLAPQEIERRRRFALCDSRIRAAMLSGVCTVNIGEAAAKLPLGQQKKLMDRFKANGDGKLTMSHVQAVKSADIEAARAALSQDLFTNPPGVEAPSYTPACAWLANSRTRLLWETLLELERSGALDLKKTKLSQRAVEDARHVIDNIRKEEGEDHAGHNGSTQ